MKKKNIKLSIKLKKKNFYVYINNTLFFSQNFLKSNNKLTNSLFTYLYILKILSRFGLISVVNKTFGF